MVFTVYMRVLIVAGCTFMRLAVLAGRASLNVVMTDPGPI